MNLTQKKIRFEKIILAFLMIIFILTQPLTILAFKPKTHVWIAQQVLNGISPARQQNFWDYRDERSSDR